MRHGSLFSGIGGFDLSAERAGFKNVWQVERDPFCLKVLEKNFPGTIRFDDIKKLTVDKLSQSLYNHLGDKNKEDFNMAAKRKEYDNAITMYNSGFSIGNIADYYDISRQAMWMILKRRDVIFRSQKKTGKENHFYRGTTASDKAQHVVERAILKGILTPKACEVCNSNGKFQDGRREVQAHHNDYNKPLEVKWLCQKCHHKWHKTNKAIQIKKEVQAEALLRTDILSGGFP